MWATEKYPVKYLMHSIIDNTVSKILLKRGLKTKLYQAVVFLISQLFKFY